MKPSDLTNKDYKPELTITADTNDDDNVLLMGKSAVIFPSADEISVSNQDFVIRRVAKNPDIILSHESVDSSIEKVNRAPMVVNPDLTLKSQISGNHALITSQTVDFRKDIIGRTSVGNPNVIFKPSSSTGNQWYNNGILIPGATGISYDMTLSGSGNYTVVKFSLRINIEN